MELHDNLYALGLRLGREVFDDPESFRGALDDFLDEDAATTGDINLLVDAVRLGAFRSMITMLDSGADVGRAIEEAGNRLSRDRGSADVAGSQWACAVLGFAVGKVSEPDVRRYRTQHPQASAQRPPAPPTMLPPVPPPAPPPQSPQQPPPTIPPFTPQQPGSYSPQPVGSSGGAPLPSKKRKKWPVVVAVVAVLAVVGGGVAAAVLTGDDSNKGAAPEKSVTSTPTDEGSDTDFDSVNGRYSALGAQVTTGVDSCEEATASSGQSEHLECSFSSGTLTLTTYDSAASLQAGRTRDVDISIWGGQYLETAGDVIYGFDASQNTDDSVMASSLYWDNSAEYQSARYEGTAGTVDAEGTALNALRRMYMSSGGTLSYPTDPTDPQLVTFLERVSSVGKCTRIPTLSAGETEENSCSGPGSITVYYGKFDKRSSLSSYRAGQKRLTVEDGGKPDVWHLTETPDIAIGRLDQYVYTPTDGSTEQAVLYWDDTDCLCYGQAYGPDADRLYSWWAGG